MQLTTAYAMLVNGGKRIEPALIERIQDRHGRAVLRRDARPCPECQNVAWAGQPTPVLPDQREQVIDPALTYQMVNLLQGVVERGTGQRAREIGKPVAGKTGTTDEVRDAWFIGLHAGPGGRRLRRLRSAQEPGRRGAGASAALPIFVDFMTAALKDEPATPFRVPPGVRLVRVDAATGLLAGPGTASAILEAYMPGTEPRGASTALRIAPPENGAAAAPGPLQQARAADRRSVLRSCAARQLPGGAERAIATRPYFRNDSKQ